MAVLDKFLEKLISSLLRRDDKYKQLVAGYKFLLQILKNIFSIKNTTLPNFSIA